MGVDPEGSTGAWSMWRSVVVAGGVLGVLLLAAAGGLYSTAHHLAAEERHQTAGLDAAQSGAAVLLGYYLDEETGLRGYLIEGDPLFLEPYRQAQAAIPASEVATAAELRSDPVATARLDEVRSAYAAWRDGYATPTLDAVQSGSLRQAQATSSTVAGKQRFDHLRTRLSALRLVLQQQQDANAANIGHAQHELEALLVAALIALGAGFVALIGLTRMKVIGPLDALTTASRRVAGGDHHAAVPLGGPAEVRALGRDITSMRSQLLEEITRARLAGEAVHQHSPTVGALSDALIPRNDQLPGLAAVGRLDPAEGVLAGDWYDLLRLDDRLAIVVGDVSGHGAPAAVLAHGLRSVINTVLRRGATPGEALSAAADHVADDIPEHFATVFVAVVDPGAGSLVYASAGHPAALLASGAMTELPPTGPLVSPVVALWSWTTRTMRFGPGDGMLVYTDGVTEGRNGEREQYGVGRLTEHLRSARSTSARASSALLASRPAPGRPTAAGRTASGTTPVEPRAGTAHGDTVHGDTASGDTANADTVRAGSAHAGRAADVVRLIADRVTDFVAGAQLDDRTLVYCEYLPADAGA